VAKYILMLIISYDTKDLNRLSSTLNNNNNNKNNNNNMAEGGRRFFNDTEFKDVVRTFYEIVT